MAREMRMPELAESVVEGEILKWLVAEGEAVALEQPIVEVMTDKVTVELPAPFAGILERHLVAEGQVVAVHAPIALIAELGVSTEDTPARPARSDEPQANPEGAEAGQGLAEERSIVEAGNVRVDQGALSSAFGSTSLNLGSPSGTEEGTGLLAVPAARRRARELGVALEAVRGSGPGGRIRLEDVEQHAAASSRAVQTAAQPTAQPVPQPASTPQTAQAGLPVPPVQYRTPKGYEHLETRTPLRGLRRMISNQMLASHLYTVRTLTVDEVDLTEVARLRERLKPQAEQAGARLTFMPFIMRAVARALKTHPSLNSSLDEATQEVVSKNYIHLGMAVGSDSGLVVPVLRDVDHKSLLELARESADLGARGHAGKLRPEELTGSSFSITNIGSIGALFSFPIINVPDAAILGVHSLQKRPVVREVGGEDTIVIRQMMYLSLSFDHRLVDGAEAARFCKTVIRLLEQPETLMLEG